MSQTPIPLDQAPDEIKLAVDLIYLLESHQIDPRTALSALAIVQQDLERKVHQAAHTEAQDKE